MGVSAAMKSIERQDVFDALADPTRRGMIERLCATPEPISISELAEHFPVTRQAVSKHLRVLEDVGLVSVEKHGRERLLTFSPGPLSDADRWLREIETRWDRRLTALRDYLAEEAESDQPARTDPQ